MSTQITRNRHKELFWEMGRKEYVFYPRICIDPLCPRTEVDCTLATTGESLTSFRFVLDWKARRAIRTEHVDERSRAFLDELVPTLDRSFWAQLSGVFQKVKDRVGDDFFVEDTVYEPPAIPAGRMVSYHDVVPFARRLTLPFLRAKHDLDDHYCVNPSCTCTKVVVAFHLIEGNVIRMDPRHPAVTLDYERGTFETIGRPMGIEEHLVDELLKRTALISRFRGRHATLQELYRHSPERIVEREEPQEPEQPAAPSAMPVPEAAGSERVGRNDSCPCGSGKKYKKCCLGKH